MPRKTIAISLDVKIIERIDEIRCLVPRSRLIEDFVKKQLEGSS